MKCLMQKPALAWSQWGAIKQIKSATWLFLFHRQWDTLQLYNVYLNRMRSVDLFSITWNVVKRPITEGETTTVTSNAPKWARGSFVSRHTYTCKKWTYPLSLDVTVEIKTHTALLQSVRYLHFYACFFFHMREMECGCVPACTCERSCYLALQSVWEGSWYCLVWHST